MPLGAHHRDELAGVFLVELAFALIGDHFALADAFHFARLYNNVSLEVEHAFQFAQRDVQQVADAARQSLEEPHVRTRAGQFDVAQTLAADAGQRDFHAALVADHAACFMRLYLPHKHSQSCVGPKIRAQKSPSRSGLNVR